MVLLTANAVFGTFYVAVRLAVDDLGPIPLAFLRLTVGWLIVAAGRLPGVAWLGEPATVFTVAGGALILAGLWLALAGRGAVG